MTTQQVPWSPGTACWADITVPDLARATGFYGPLLGWRFETGGPETGGESSYDSTYFKSSGVVYTASTGDDAYQYGVIYPATSVDTVAVGVVQAAEARGIQVGPELAVTGFDDTPLAEHIRPRLTTLRQPVWDVGRAVIRLLIAQLHDEDISPEGRHVLLAPELIVRESSLGYAPR